MKKLFKIVLPLCLLLAGIVPSTYGQKKIQELSKHYETQWQQNRTYAESVATAQNFPIKITRDDGTIIELQRFSKGKPVYYKTDNINAAKTISTNKVWPGGGTAFNLTGSGELLGEWDGGGVKTTHQELTGRVTQSQGTLSTHSTHVAGTMIATGITANAKGMAYQATLKAYDWNSDVSEMMLAASNGMRVSNHSYGLVTGWDFNTRNDNRWVWFGDTSISQTEDNSFGFYDNEAQNWDNVAFGAPNYLIVKSAGNDRGDGPGGTVEHWVYIAGAWRLITAARPLDGGTSGYDCISSSSLSKNVLTVGSIADIIQGYYGPAGVVMSSYSGWGPTDDGRIKPDVVANGEGLYSTIESSNTSYGTLSGTSMATPSVTGSIGLLLQQQRRMHGTTPLLSSTLKGIIIHTADEAGTSNGPDYKFGWGLANTWKAAQLMQQDSLDGYDFHIIERTLLEGSTIEIPISYSGTGRLRATICWTDPAGTIPASILDNPQIVLVNDLDLRIVKNVNDSLCYPWILDLNNPSAAATTGDNIRDNVEQIDFVNPKKGTYKLIVSHKGALQGDSQKVSILISGNSPSIGTYAHYQYDTMRVSMNPDDSLETTFRIFNNGDSTLNYSLSASAPSWFTIDTGSASIGYNDSTRHTYRINTTGLSQWQTYTTSFTITSNDPSKPTKVVPVILSTLGPLLSRAPSSIIMEAETTETKLDTIMLKNPGYQPLNFWVTTSDPAACISMSADSGTIVPGDSLPFVLTFDGTAAPEGDYLTTLSFFSNDSLTGTLTTTLEFRLATRRTISVNVHPRWNMVSAPLRAFSYDKSALYPNAVSSAYYYNNGYFSANPLQLGKGYWIKLDSSRTYNIDGLRSLTDTLDVTTGWNLIGMISSSLPVSSITSDPPGMITSEFYAYNPVGYYDVDTLIPGGGYWVNVNQNGKLILAPNTGFSASTIRIVPTRILPPTPPETDAPGAGTVVPTTYALGQNYPNPFNPSTVINYSLPVNSYVTLKVYTILGNEVATLVDGMQDAGFKMVEWNAVNLPSGVYIYKLTAGDFSDVKKTLLMK